MMKIYRSTEILECLEELIPVYQAAFNASGEKVDRFKAQVKSAVQRCVNPVVVVLYEDGSPVGAVWGIDFVPGNWLSQQISDELPTGRNWHDGTFEVNDIFVVPERQGNGKGQELMMGLESYCADRTILLCTSRNNNGRVLDFYHQLGYEPIIDSVRLGGFDDVTVFVKYV